MPRALIGGLLGGVLMWIVGFIFWGTPLSRLAISTADESTNAVLQATLTQYLSSLGTGAYQVPWPGSAQGTQAYGQGPVSMIFFNINGFAHPDASALITGLILSVICGVVFAFALERLTQERTFGGRMAAVVAISLAFCTYGHISQPIYNHLPWDYFIFLWLSQFLGWLAAGFVIAKMLPNPPAVVSATEEPVADPVVDPYQQPGEPRF